MNKNGKVIFGVVLIIVGISALLGNYDMINIYIWELWPLIILGIGLVFEFSYFLGAKKEIGLLMPGGILITISINFIICIIFGWNMMSITWPLFMIAPGIGLLQLYIFGDKNREVLIPSIILLSLGSLFLLKNLSSFRNLGVGFAIILIVIGIVLIFGKNHDDNDSEKTI